MTKNVLVNTLFCIAIASGFGFGSEVRVDDHTDPTTGGVDVVQLQSGRFIIAWEGKNSAADVISAWSSFSDDFGSTWSSSIQISDSDAVTPQFPRIATDSLNVLYAVWHDWRGPEVYAPYFSRSIDGGNTWLSPNVRVSDPGEVGLSPSIASNGDGSVLVVVFDRLTENRIYSSSSTDGGNSWSGDSPVGEFSVGGQYFPIIEYTGQQSYTAIWKDERGALSSLYCSVSEDDGQTWLSPNILVPSGGNDVFSRSIDLHWDGMTLHAFWIESYDSADGTIYKAFYSRSSDSGYSWLENPVQIDMGYYNTQMHRGGIWAKDPGTVYATWCYMTNQSYPIYAVCSSSDSGMTWSDTLRANPVSGEAGRCDLYGETSSGEILVAWSNLSNQQIMCARGSENSGFQFQNFSHDLQISRNPFNGSVSIWTDAIHKPSFLQVLDFTGRVVNTLYPSDTGSFEWVPCVGIAPGIYLIRGVVGGIEYTRKVIRL